MPCRNEPARERVPAEADRATTNRNEQRRTLFVAWRRHATPTGRAVEQRARRRGGTRLDLYRPLVLKQ